MLSLKVMIVSTLAKKNEIGEISMKRLYVVPYFTSVLIELSQNAFTSY